MIKGVIYCIKEELNKSGPKNRIVTEYVKDAINGIVFIGR
jgi:hypothetical protein